MQFVSLVPVEFLEELNLPIILMPKILDGAKYLSCYFFGMLSCCFLVYTFAAASALFSLLLSTLLLLLSSLLLFSQLSPILSSPLFADDENVQVHTLNVL
jgi:hypothetical protein